MKLRHIVLCGILSVLLPISLSAQNGSTENTLKLAEGALGEKASISDMQWLAGQWLGTGLGGISEEIWGSPAAGVMIGAYRLIKDDKPVFYEMMMLVEKEGTLVLRLKHFDPNFVAWEEKDKTVDFRFIKKDGKRTYFSGLTFENAGSKELNIYLALKSRDGAVREEIFRMKRAD